MLTGTTLKDKEKALLEATLSLVNNRGFHDAPMSKIAKLANVAPATIYLYFENKQDLINKLYLHIKAEFCENAFRNYSEDMPVQEGIRLIWENIAHYKMKNIAQALFLSLVDVTPMIDESSKEKGLQHLKPLLNLWERGQKEGVIKDCSPYLLYAYTISPLSFLVSVQQNHRFNLTEEIIEKSYELTWDSIKK